MLALFIAVFIASLLGSTHCAGMCGAFAAFAVTGGERPAHPVALTAAYNGGRLITYTALGAASGFIGSAIDLGTSAVGLQRGAAILAGALMLGFAAIGLARHFGARLPRAYVPPLLHRAAAAGHRLAFNRPPVQRAVAIGLLTTLLPCGWLYAFVITAAGTGSPLLGAATMASFWLGTLPIMAALGAGVRTLAGPLRAKLPVATSFLLAIVGIWTIAGRLNVPAPSLAARTNAESSAASAAGMTDLAGDDTSPAIHGDIQHAVERLRSLDHAELPCCHGG